MNGELDIAKQQAERLERLLDISGRELDKRDARIAELEAENTRLRELVLSAKEHIGCCCMDCARIDNARREEMKRWERAAE